MFGDQSHHAGATSYTVPPLICTQACGIGHPRAASDSVPPRHLAPPPPVHPQADDDTFVHLPAILSHFRAIPAAAAPHAIYGTFSWWHVLQHPGHHFLFSGFGGRRGGAISAASRYGLAGRCNATNVSCHGPFPFPNGPFFAVGRALAAAVTTAPGVTDDQAAFERLPAGHRRIVEDVWLGSAVWRHVGHTAPVQLFPLGHQGRLFNDAGGCNVTRDVAIFHVR